MLALGQVIAYCSRVVLQKAPIGAFCNTIILHSAATHLYITIINLYKVSSLQSFY